MSLYSLSQASYAHINIVLTDDGFVTMYVTNGRSAMLRDGASGR